MFVQFSFQPTSRVAPSTQFGVVSHMKALQMDSEVQVCFYSLASNQVAP